MLKSHSRDAIVFAASSGKEIVITDPASWNDEVCDGAPVCLPPLCLSLATRVYERVSRRVCMCRLALVDAFDFNPA